MTVAASLRSARRSVAVPLRRPPAIAASTTAVATVTMTANAARDRRRWRASLRTHIHAPAMAGGYITRPGPTRAGPPRPNGCQHPFTRQTRRHGRPHRPSTEIRRRHRTRLARLDALVAAGSRAARGCTERAAHRARRRRLRAARLLRIRHRDAHVRPARARRHPAHELPHDGSVLTH